MENFGIQWEYRHLLDTMDEKGMYVKDKAGIGAWSFVPQCRGQVVSQWIDGGRDHDFLEDEEKKTCVAAFRHGYREGLRTALVRLDPVPEHLVEEELRFYVDRDSAVDGAAMQMIRVMTLEAKDARIRFRWEKTMAFPQAENRRRAGQVVYPVGHWRHAAYLRGVYLACEQIALRWQNQESVRGDVEASALTELREVTIPGLLECADFCEECAMPSVLHDPAVFSDYNVRSRMGQLQKMH